MKISTKLIMICTLVNAQIVLFGAIPIRIAQPTRVENPVVEPRMEQPRIVEEQQGGRQREQEEAGQGQNDQNDQNQPPVFANTDEKIKYYFGEKQEYTPQAGIGILRSYLSRPHAQRVKSPGQAFWASVSIIDAIKSDEDLVGGDEGQEQSRELTIDELKSEFSNVASLLVARSNQIPLNFARDKSIINGWMDDVFAVAKAVLVKDKSLRYLIDKTLSSRLSDVKGLSDSERQKIYRIIQTRISQSK
jgi:hypothetical protein